MKIAIWTTREPKVNWIKEWVNQCPYFKDIKEDIMYILEKVPSDISDMPISIEETITWAKNRAKNLIKKWIKADYYIWIEWWTYRVYDRAYIVWSVYIENSAWKWHYGFSSSMEVPKKVEKMLYEEKQELWPIMDKLSWEVNIWSKNGSMWAWSDDMFTRKGEFTDAFKAAISPFYNEYYNL